MENTTHENRYFEDYLTATGWGLYNNFIVGLACCFNFVQAATFVAIPLAVAISSCDANFIPEIITLRIFTSFYVGSCIGGLVINFLCDRYGRKRYLSYSLMLVFMSTFTAAFSYNPYVIIGASLFMGVGLEINTTSIKLLLIEVLPTKKRGFYMIFCSLFWASGYIFTTVLTIFFETPTMSNTEKTPELNLTTWRIMFAVCGGANLLLACACALIEESPRFFLQTGRSYLAYLVLKQVYAINKSDFAENYKIKEEEIKNVISAYSLFYLEPEQYWDLFKKLNWRFYKSLRLIFSERFRRTTEVLILLKIPVLVIGVLQLNITLAKQLTFNTFANISQSEFRGLDFVYPVLKPLTYMSKHELKQSASICAVNDHNSTFYKYFLVLAFAMVPGLIISMLVVDRIGRKVVLFSGLLVAGASFLILRFIKQSAIQLVSSCLILASMSSAIPVSSLINLEVYPTAFRATSCGVTNFFGLLLAVFFMNFIAIEPHIFVIVMGALYLCLAGSVLFLPELKGQPMIE